MRENRAYWLTWLNIFYFQIFLLILHQPQSIFWSTLFIWAFWEISYSPRVNLVTLFMYWSLGNLVLIACFWWSFFMAAFQLQLSTDHYKYVLVQPYKIKPFNCRSNLHFLSTISHFNNGEIFITWLRIVAVFSVALMNRQE